MKTWFVERNNQVVSIDISSSQMNSYKDLLIMEMEKIGASEHKIGLIDDNLVLNSIKNGRQPGDVAWAILQ